MCGKENHRKKKWMEKKSKKMKEDKNRFKVNKLFLYSILNSFYLFSLFHIKIK